MSNPNEILIFTRKSVERPLALDHEHRCFRGAFLPEGQRCSTPIKAGQFILVETAPTQDDGGNRGVMYSHLETCIPVKIAKLIPGPHAHGCRLHPVDLPSYRKLHEVREEPGALVARDAAHRAEKLKDVILQTEKTNRENFDRAQREMGEQVFDEFLAAVDAAVDAAMDAAMDAADQDAAELLGLGELASKAVEVTTANAIERLHGYKVGAERLAEKAVAHDELVVLKDKAAAAAATAKAKAREEAEQEEREQEEQGQEESEQEQLAAAGRSRGSARSRASAAIAASAQAPTVNKNKGKARGSASAASAGRPSSSAGATRTSGGASSSAAAGGSSRGGATRTSRASSSAAASGSSSAGAAGGSSSAGAAGGLGDDQGAQGQGSGRRLRSQASGAGASEQAPGQGKQKRKGPDGGENVNPDAGKKRRNSVTKK